MKKTIIILGLSFLLLIIAGISLIDEKVRKF